MSWFGKLLKRNFSILVVDDNDEIANLLVMFLKSRKYQVERARNGIEGLHAMRRMNPDLVLLDITMPGMDGIEVLTKAKSDPKIKSVPIVMCTDHAFLADVEKCCERGADGYILKPFDFTKVLEKVCSVLEKK